MNICGHVLDDHVCVKPAGHTGFHAEGQYMWGTCDELATFVPATAVNAAGDRTAGSRS